MDHESESPENTAQSQPDTTSRDLTQPLSSRVGRVESMVSPWVQRALRRASRSSRSPTDATTPRVALSFHHTVDRLNRIRRSVNETKAWRPDVGSVSPGAFRSFAGAIVRRHRTFSNKSRRQSAEQYPVPERDSELPLAHYPSIRIASHGEEGGATRSPSPSSASYSTPIPQQPPQPPSGGHAPSAPQASQIRRRPEAPDTASAPKRPRRIYSRVEEITPGGTMTESDASQRPPPEAEPADDAVPEERRPVGAVEEVGAGEEDVERTDDTAGVADEQIASEESPPGEERSTDDEQANEWPPASVDETTPPSEESSPVQRTQESDSGAHLDDRTESAAPQQPSPADEPPPTEPTTPEGHADPTAEDHSTPRPTPQSDALDTTTGGSSTEEEGSRVEQPADAAGPRPAPREADTSLQATSDTTSLRRTPAHEQPSARPDELTPETQRSEQDEQPAEAAAADASTESPTVQPTRQETPVPQYEPDDGSAEDAGAQPRTDTASMRRTVEPESTPPSAAEPGKSGVSEPTGSGTGGRREETSQSGRELSVSSKSEKEPAFETMQRPSEPQEVSGAVDTPGVQRSPEPDVVDTGRHPMPASDVDSEKEIGEARRRAEQTPPPADSAPVRRTEESPPGGTDEAPTASTAPPAAAEPAHVRRAPDPEEPSRPADRSEDVSAVDRERQVGRSQEQATRDVAAAESTAHTSASRHATEQDELQRSPRDEAIAFDSEAIESTAAVQEPSDTPTVQRTRAEPAATDTPSSSEPSAQPPPESEGPDVEESTPSATQPSSSPEPSAQPPSEPDEPNVEEPTPSAIQPPSSPEPSVQRTPERDTSVSFDEPDTRSGATRHVQRDREHDVPDAPTPEAFARPEESSDPRTPAPSAKESPSTDDGPPLRRTVDETEPVPSSPAPPHESVQRAESESEEPQPHSVDRDAKPAAERPIQRTTDTPAPPTDAPSDPPASSGEGEQNVSVQDADEGTSAEPSTVQRTSDPGSPPGSERHSRRDGSSPESPSAHGAAALSEGTPADERDIAPASGPTEAHAGQPEPPGMSQRTEPTVQAKASSRDEGRHGAARSSDRMASHQEAPALPLAERIRTRTATHARLPLTSPTVQRRPADTTRKTTPQASPAARSSAQQLPAHAGQRRKRGTGMVRPPVETMVLSRVRAQRVPEHVHDIQRQPNGATGNGRSSAGRTWAAPPQEATDERLTPPEVSQVHETIVRRTPLEFVQRTLPAPAVDTERESMESAEVSVERDDTTEEALDLDRLARQIYPIVKRMIAVERERRPGR